MSYDINPGNAEWVAKIVNDAIGDGRFSQGEVLLGLGEAIGRLIVTMAATPVEGFQCVGVVGDHLRRTIIAGYSAKGFNMGESVQ